MRWLRLLAILTTLKWLAPTLIVFGTVQYVGGEFDSLGDNSIAARAKNGPAGCYMEADAIFIGYPLCVGSPRAKRAEHVMSAMDSAFVWPLAGDGRIFAIFLIPFSLTLWLILLAWWGYTRLCRDK